MNCYNLGNISTSTTSVGGIVGYGTSENNIFNCVNSGDIGGGANYDLGIGGIDGYATSGSIITNCKSNCKLSGQENTGGIIGCVGGDGNLTISDCMWYTDSGVQYGVGSLFSNEGATYVENLQLDSVLDIVNGENNFKSNGGKVVLNWQ